MNEPIVFKKLLKRDKRGYFYQVFNKSHFFYFEIFQVNQSFNKKKGTLRGLHFQAEPKAQGKIVQCLKGEIFDVAVDLRKNSDTYGKSISCRLSEKNKKVFFIPPGYAHGYQTLTDDCLVQYFVSNNYSPKHEGGILWNDKRLNIEWPLENPILSSRDKNWPKFNHARI